MTKTLKKTTRAWNEAKELLSVPRTKREYENLVTVLDELLTQIGNNESHSLARLAMIWKSLICLWKKINELGFLGRYR